MQMKQQHDEKETMSNFLSLVKAVIPFIPAQQFLVQENSVGKATKTKRLFYSLSDLWETFTKWSCYGRGVPTLINDKELVTQFYVPYLSAIQLYVDPFLRGTNNSGDSSETLVYEYFETERPHNRMPLTNKALSLASLFPELNTMKSSDLSPTSWISVAWYPICRDSIGSTLAEIETCFLTYHLLSTQSTRYSSKKDKGRKKGKKSEGARDRKSRVSLPVFGVAHRKYKGSLLLSSEDYESKKEKSLTQAAEQWIRDRKILHPDYEFFQSHP